MMQQWAALVELQSGIGMHGGPANPLGARAMYLWQGNKDTYFRIDGTNEPLDHRAERLLGLYSHDQPRCDGSLPENANRHAGGGARFPGGHRSRLTQVPCPFDHARANSPSMEEKMQMNKRWSVHQIGQLVMASCLAAIWSGAAGTLCAASRQRSQRRWMGGGAEAGRGAVSRQGLAHLFPGRRRLRQSRCLRVPRSRRDQMK
jgi:hypothetical protein